MFRRRRVVALLLVEVAAAEAVGLILDRLHVDL
jgi:hypothetical protein